LPSVEIVFAFFCFTRLPDRVPPLSLLPVQTKPPFKFRTFVFFVTFCSNHLRFLLFHPFAGPRAATESVTRTDQTPLQIPYLRFLCYLLFKSSSLPFV
jgi:hypothetical protein